MIIVIFVLNSSFLSLSLSFDFSLIFLFFLLSFFHSSVWLCIFLFFIFRWLLLFCYWGCCVGTDVLFSFARLSPLVDLKVRLISMLFSAPGSERGTRATLLELSLYCSFVFGCFGLSCFCFVFLVVCVCVCVCVCVYIYICVCAVCFVGGAVDEYCLDTARLAPHSIPSLLSLDIVHFLLSCTIIQQSARLDVLMNPLFIPSLSGCRRGPK